MNNKNYNSIDQIIGKTPLVKLQRLNPNPSNAILLKLEGNNPAGSVKDRAALSMISQAEKRGEIKPGDQIIEATSGNTGIALAMIAAIKGYQMTLIMPANLSQERRDAMTAYGAKLILVSEEEGGMEGARDIANQMEIEGKGKQLDQFSNEDNPFAHISSTGEEIWKDTNGGVTHFVSSMGTTGTITGVSQYLKSKNSDIQIIGVRPTEGSQIPGIRRWSEEYIPSISKKAIIDQTIDISQLEAENTMRLLAKQEGIFAGVSTGGAAAVAIKLSSELSNATIVSIACDRGDRYLSTGIFSN
ncbi:cysteine synthase CysM [Gammaproteobacteria bacterium]|nr:cysteine synthase CysM [Gammaproteobacteria bacterium]